MAVMIEDVHSRAAQIEEVLTQMRDRCEGFITAATIMVKNIVEDAEAGGEATHQERSKWEEEKARIATTHTFDPKIKLDVGGHSFTTTRAVLTRFPDTMLGAMFSGRHALIKDENGAYFIDRDGRHFHEILNYLRDPEAFTTDDMPARVRVEVEIEADFFGLKDLMLLSPRSPFVPAAPAKVTDAKMRMVIVTHDDAGLWYMQTARSDGYPRCLVKVCNTCGWGQPSSLPSSTDYNHGIPRFAKITDTQPRKTGMCNWNGDHCTCE
jgi:hypothetical protein